MRTAGLVIAGLVTKNLAVSLILNASVTPLVLTTPLRAGLEQRSPVWETGGTKDFVTVGCGL